MTFPFLKQPPLLCALAFAVLTGCERKTVREYIAPKDRPFVPAETADDERPSKREDAWRPALQWTLPAGWKDLGPDAGNVGRFSAGPATVAITALALMEGRESILVNMWRQVHKICRFDFWHCLLYVPSWAHQHNALNSDQ